MSHKFTWLDIFLVNYQEIHICNAGVSGVKGEVLLWPAEIPEKNATRWFWFFFCA